MARTNNIALVFDFDWTLTKELSEEPIFKEYNYDGKKLWKKSYLENEKRLQELKKRKKIGIFGPEATLCRETTYADVLVDFVQTGKFKGLTLDKLYELGDKIKFHPGVPEFMPELQKFIKSREEWRKYNIKLEFYVISCAIEEMIKGSKIAPYLTGLFATKFSENEKGISQVVHAISYTEKTKFLYKINKGPEFNENAYVSSNERRIDKNKIIYCADGITDVPCCSTVGEMGGERLGVYIIKKEKSREEVDKLKKQGRFDEVAEANYDNGGDARVALEKMVTKIANKIVKIYK